MNLDTQVKLHFHELTPNDYDIWQYICDHREECRNGTISQLATACHVSSAAITRFTKKVGLSGFSELKVALKWQEDSRPVLEENLIERCFQDYELTMDYLKGRDYTDVFALIDQSKRIFAFGTGEVQRHAAKELKRLFLNVYRQVYTIEGENEFSAAIKCAGEGDLFIVFSLSGNNVLTNEKVRRLRERGTKILSVTSYEDNALKKISEANICYYNHCVLRGRTPGTDCHLSAQFFLISEIVYLKYLEHLNPR
ncbi:MurR/RpiR family transcriptional regulator [Eubacterium aggregans]|uniref:Transcriptional regulator, RpiR family n=1 Tax=Eubacterium aggregans TaxID=81409 RepID=A0A1H3WTH4_9FIRM|nr:MurR/RpiR family transcriptional regulator [Eubacterium aggregans]MDD4692066.1 MurR/RpiR family transcriptional regulator [Eubacterium aggregans]SDZ89498.1 transcriptional regulator, RpiR family [Eubacterium aggregans]